MKMRVSRMFLLILRRAFELTPTKTNEIKKNLQTHKKSEISNIITVIPSLIHITLISRNVLDEVFFWFCF